MIVLSHFAMIDDHIRATYLPHVKYITDRTDSGIANGVIELSPDLSYINATIVTPISGYKYIEVPLYQRLFEGMIMGEFTPQSGWHSLLDNGQFDADTLREITSGTSSKLLPRGLIFLFFFFTQAFYPFILKFSIDKVIY